MYDDIIEEALEDLKDKVETNKLSDDKCNNFISDSDWEDDFSHNEIGEMQEIFMSKAKEYLSEKCKGKYMIYCDWCVHICSIEFFDKYLKGSLVRYFVC